MTSGAGRPDERAWLIEPPNSGEIKFQIALGDQVEVTPEMRQAFDNLVSALSTADVEGYTDACIDYIKGCTSNSFNCDPRQRCAHEGQAPCFMNYFCKIAT
jgi:hypothetical protein